MNVKYPKWLYVLPLVLLQACGGGGGDKEAATLFSSNVDPVDSLQVGAPIGTQTAGATASPAQYAASPWVQQGPISANDARRFLTQASFGPTEAEVIKVQTMGYEGWVLDQFNKPLPTQTHLAYFRIRDAEHRAHNSTARGTYTDVTDNFWRQALVGEDQLRQRMALALSEIFVVSFLDSCGFQQESMADYLDMLTRNAFGNFRTLLEDVARHPIMGCYLTHRANQKDDPATGRVPDENFAREIMQLFTVGLHHLNLDGSAVLVNGQKLETYGPSDVAGLARVFTGFSFACPSMSETSCFVYGDSTLGVDADRWIKPMVAYDRYHATQEKSFLGYTFPAQSTANANASLKFALDSLSSHPNVAPFISKQLIQRLVTSNPSPGYVGRVATVFNDNGSGVRGDLKAVLKAILTDTEARNTAAALASSQFGKVREPILRLSALLRALDGKSMTGRYMVGITHFSDNGYGQGVLMSPSVFNFFRPGYVPAGSHTAAANLVAPELQLANESSVAGYAYAVWGLLTYGQGTVPNFGAGINGEVKPDVYLDFQRNTSAALRAQTDDPAAFVELLNQRLLYGTMSTSLRTDLVAAISSITDSRPEIRQPQRVALALLITATSPEFLVQR